MAFDFTEDIYNMKEAFMGPPEKKVKRKGLDGVNDLLNYFNEVSDDNSIQTRKQAALNPIGPSSKDKYKSFAGLAGIDKPVGPSEFATDLTKSFIAERDRQQETRDKELNKKDPVATSVTTGYRGLPLLSRNDQRAIEDDGIIDITAKNKEDMKIKLPDVGASSSRPKLGTTARGGVGATAKLGSGKNDQLKKARKLRRMGFGPAAMRVAYNWASTPESDAPNIFNQAMRDQLMADQQQADSISKENQRLAALLRKNTMEEAKKGKSLFELRA